MIPRALRRDKSARLGVQGVRRITKEPRIDFFDSKGKGPISYAHADD